MMVEEFRRRVETSGGAIRYWPEVDVNWRATMRKLALALALTVMGAAGASAQGIEFRIGPDADRYERSRERVIVRDRRDRDWDDDRVVRRRDVVTTGSTCRTTVVYRENDRGQRVKRTIRECD
jgi:hypothetical protein